MKLGKINKNTKIRHLGKCCQKSTKYNIMRKMVLCVADGVEMLFPASKNGEDGIYVKTKRGGKIFYIFADLLDYFIKNTNETTRIKK